MTELSRISSALASNVNTMRPCRGPRPCRRRLPSNVALLALITAALCAAAAAGALAGGTSAQCSTTAFRRCCCCARDVRRSAPPCAYHPQALHPRTLHRCSSPACLPATSWSATGPCAPACCTSTIAATSRWRRWVDLGRRATRHPAAGPILRCFVVMPVRPWPSKAARLSPHCTSLPADRCLLTGAT